MAAKVETFSVDEANPSNMTNVKKLKEHSKKTGISFSFLILEAIKLKIAEMEAEASK